MDKNYLLWYVICTVLVTNLDYCCHVFVCIMAGAILLLSLFFSYFLMIYVLFLIIFRIFCYFNITVTIYFYKHYIIYVKVMETKFSYMYSMISYSNYTCTAWYLIQTLWGMQFIGLCIQTRIGIGCYPWFQLPITYASKQQHWHCNPFPFPVSFGIHNPMQFLQLKANFQTQP
jgi:hypothetical protein